MSNSILLKVTIFFVNQLARIMETSLLSLLLTNLIMLFNQPKIEKEKIWDVWGLILLLLADSTLIYLLIYSYTEINKRFFRREQIDSTI
jgi:hypothetical protein